VVKFWVLGGVLNNKFFSATFAALREINFQVVGWVLNTHINFFVVFLRVFVSSWQNNQSPRLTTAVLLISIR